MRFADDFVCCFQYKDDADRFMRALTPRLAKFNLTLSAEKTRLLRFTRFETSGGNTFTFLGFEYRWETSRTGRPIVRLRTSPKKLRQAVQTVTRWLRKNCRGKPAHAILATLARKLRGHYNYYGVCGNARGIWRYYREVVRLLFKWLNRRSQRRSYNWKGFLAMCEHFRLPRPKIVAYWD